MSDDWSGRLRRLDRYRWEIPQTYKAGMRVPGIVFASDAIMEQVKSDQALEQVANVACLPGIVRASLAMPDIHWGYGFPVGGVAATDADHGVVSPGGIGFDINCGVRLLRTDLVAQQVTERAAELGEQLFRAVPAGLGSEGKVRLKGNDIDKVLKDGAGWAVRAGYGLAADLEHAESNGRIETADPDRVSEKAKKRGAPQLGSLGSGNHFLEVQAIDEIYDPQTARVLGLTDVDQVVVFIHTGSRGLGHQVCQDYLRVMAQVVKRLGIELPDRQLACAPIRSPEGQEYLAAMAAAANFAWANRQCITHWVREAFAATFKKSEAELGMALVYDVAHNIAKMETYVVDDMKKQLCVHRKGATRAFPPGDLSIPASYRAVGQPVLVPGDMGRYSFVAVGTERAMRESFGSACHGAGRVMSRGAAKRSLQGVDIARELRERGVLVRATDRAGLAEEASQAYRDVADVMEVVDGAGLARKVARMRPLVVVKG
ncbi:MAG: RtcB family protein [Chloroflexota bacterium]|nr:MAG: RtcB family protein [Chloroflexota bacterium]